MAEPEVTVPAPTAPPEPAPEAPSAEAPTTETPTYLTRDEAQALIEATLSDRETNMRKELDAAYKTLRRGEAKSDTSLKRIEKLETELFDLSLRGMEPQQQEVAKLQRQVQQQSITVDPNAEIAAFRAESASILEEEGISADDPVLRASFDRRGEGWTSRADLRVALTRAIADVHKERAKAAKADASKQAEKAREEERAKLRNEKREKEGPLDKGTPAPAAAPKKSKNWLAASPEEWDALQAQKGLRR